MTYDQYLAHHGILGMHWGVRRFQNPDGSLTPAGERRYDVDGSKISKRKQRKAFAKAQQRTADYINNEYIHKLNSKKLSTEEHNKRFEKEYNRRLDEEYRKALDAYSSKSNSSSRGEKKTISEHTSLGKIIMKNMLRTSAAQAGVFLVGGAAYAAAAKTGNAALEKIASSSLALAGLGVTVAGALRTRSEAKQYREYRERKKQMQSSQ